MDGPDFGLVNAFVPLVATSSVNGTTNLVPGSQRVQLYMAPAPTPNANAMPSEAPKPIRQASIDAEAASPELAAGEVLLFSYRTRHRGGGNPSNERRPVMYYTFGADGKVDDHNFPSDNPLL
jgi:ectoine hydroxylase-related dioxygenase (phytanoyl-CoA dioxygenase family)